MNFRRFRGSLLAGVASFFMLTTPAWAANTYFLKIGDIKGGSTDKVFKDNSSLSSWSWGLSNSNGTPAFQDFIWTQGIDTSVVPLFLGVANNTTFDKATLSVVSAGANSSFMFFEMVFTAPHLTSLSMNGSGDEQVQAALAYTQVDMRYRSGSAGGQAGTWITGSFMIGDHKPASFSGDPNVIQGLFESGGSVNLAGLAPVPEPENWAMLLAGLALLAGISSRRVQKARAG